MYQGWQTIRAQGVVAKAAPTGSGVSKLSTKANKLAMSVLDTAEAGQ